MLIDAVFLSYQLRDQLLPKNPSALLIWAIVFVFPHIIASFITLLDKEYWAFYKKRLLKALVLISSAVFCINLLLPHLLDATQYRTLAITFFIFYSAYTMYHVLSQQLGIGMVLMQRPSSGAAYERLRWLASIGGALLYLMVFAEYFLKGIQWQGYSVYSIAQITAVIAIALASIQGVWLAKQSKRALGTWYNASNLIMLWAIVILLSLGYSFFVIAIPRIVHDLSAFMVYSVHDENRNQIKQHNLLYKKLAFLGMPITVICVFAAILIANTIQCSSFVVDTWLGFQGNNTCVLHRYYTSGNSTTLPSSMQLWFQLMLITGLFHYYIESFIWKKDSLHRHQVSFS